MSHEDADAAVVRHSRADGGRVISILTGQFRDFDLAEEVWQEALVAAVTDWRANGVPANPTGWLFSTAKRKAIDRMRRAQTASRPETLAQLAREGETGIATDPRIEEHSAIDDDDLRLMLLCCHPALALESQVALTLRTLGGLTTSEIAAGFLIPESAVAQRIVRAKRKIRDAGIPLTIPADVASRVPFVLAVLYLVHNESYLGHAEGSPVRADLGSEALRLTRRLAVLVPGNAEVEGLLALQVFTQSRAVTRADAGGALVLLADQDRTQWDLALVHEGNAILAEALSRLDPGPYQLQALIAGYHANARTAEDTPWPDIVAAYAQLIRMTPSRVMRLNHAVAVAMADGPHQGLALLEAVDGLDTYHLWHAARAELLWQAGNADAALASFERALELANRPAERRHLERRITAVRSR